MKLMSRLIIHCGYRGVDGRVPAFNPAGFDSKQVQKLALHCADHTFRETRPCVSSSVLLHSLLLSLKGSNGWNFSYIGQKKAFFILLNKFNLHTAIYDSLKFQTSIIVLQSFIRQYVNLCAI